MTQRFRCALVTSAAAKRLRRLADKDRLTRVTKGLWANTGHPYFHPLACVPYVLGKEQGYVSFLTALHLHAVISQIPNTVQVATSGRGRLLDSPVARFELFQIKPELDLVHSGFQQRQYRRLMKRLPIPTRVLSAMNSRWHFVTVSQAIPIFTYYFSCMGF